MINIGSSDLANVLRELEKAKEEVEKLKRLQEEATKSLDEARQQAESAKLPKAPTINEIMEDPDKFDMNLSSENDFKRVQYIQELQKEFSPMTIEKPNPVVELMIEESRSNLCYGGEVCISCRIMDDNWDDSDIISVNICNSSNCANSLYKDIDAPYEDFVYIIPPQLSVERNCNTYMIPLPNFVDHFYVSYSRRMPSGPIRMEIAKTSIFSVAGPLIEGNFDSLKNSRGVRRRGGGDIHSKVLLCTYSEVVFSIKAINISFTPWLSSRDASNISLHRVNCWIEHINDVSSGKWKLIVECDAIVTINDIERSLDCGNLNTISTRVIYGEYMISEKIFHDGCAVSISVDSLNSMVQIVNGVIQCRIPFRELSREVVDLIDSSSLTPSQSPDAFDDLSSTYIQCKFCGINLWEVDVINQLRLLPSGNFDRIMHEMVCCDLPIHAMSISEMETPFNVGLVGPMTLNVRLEESKLDELWKVCQSSNHVDSIQSTTKSLSMDFGLIDIYSTEGCDIAVQMENIFQCSELSNTLLASLSFRKRLCCRRCHSMVGILITRALTSRSHQRKSRNESIQKKENTLDLQFSLKDVNVPSKLEHLLLHSGFSGRSWPWKNLSMTTEQAVARSMIRLFDKFGTVNYIILPEEYLQENLSVSILMERKALFVKMLSKEVQLFSRVIVDETIAWSDPFITCEVKSVGINTTNKDTLFDFRLQQMQDGSRNLSQLGNRSTNDNTDLKNGIDWGTRAVVKVSFQQCSVTEAMSLCKKNGGLLPIANDEFNSVAKNMEMRKAIVQQKMFPNQDITFIYQ